MKEKNKDNKKIRRSRVIELIRENKKATVVYLILRTITIGVMVRAVFLGQWESVFTCVLALVLFTVPHFLERKLRISLPSALEIVAFCFVFCAEILGEIGCYYVKYSFWDSMLHTVSGFIFAAFGFCIVDMLNREKRIRFELSPASLAIVAFCFSMTTGVIWEFFEFAADLFLHTDMQKDFFVERFSSVTLDAMASNTPVEVESIVGTSVLLADGRIVTLDGGYLDIGLFDTMKDLFVNFIGAVIFSVIGYFYVKHRGKGIIAPNFIPVVDPLDEENKETEEITQNEDQTENNK